MEIIEPYFFGAILIYTYSELMEDPIVLLVVLLWDIRLYKVWLLRYTPQTRPSAHYDNNQEGQTSSWGKCGMETGESGEKDSLKETKWLAFFVLGLSGIL